MIIQYFKSKENKYRNPPSNSIIIVNKADLDLEKISLSIIKTITYNYKIDYLFQRFSSKNKLTYKGGMFIYIQKGSKKKCGDFIRKGRFSKYLFQIDINIPKSTKEMQKFYRIGTDINEMCQKEALKFYKTIVHEFTHFRDYLTDSNFFRSKGKMLSSNGEKISKNEESAYRAEQLFQYDSDILNEITNLFQNYYLKKQTFMSQESPLYFFDL